MKRYLLFAGCDYEAAGGWGDFVADHDTHADATCKGRHLENIEWFHVVDLESGAIVETVDLVKERHAAWKAAKAEQDRK